jgi:hypothetical protein
MKTIKRNVVCSIVLALAVVALAAAQESYRMEYKFQKGKMYQYRAASNNDITQEVQGQEMKIASHVHSVVRVLVDDVLSDGSMVLVISADSMVSQTKNPMIDTTMVMTSMIGKRMKLTVGKTGNVQSREVIDSMQYDMAGMNTRTPQREVMNILVLPPKELKVGDKWNDSKTDTADVGTGKMFNTMDVEYTLAGTEAKSGHQCLKINYVGKISTNGKMNRMGMDIYTEGTGKISGTLYFDHVKGLIVHDESTRDVESTVAVTGQQNMTIPMTTSTKTTLDLLGN